jgi:hypothetical protein
MCGVCDNRYEDFELINLIKEDNVPNDILLCDKGWSGLSRIWGRYGWAKKLYRRKNGEQSAMRAAILNMGISS